LESPGARRRRAAPLLPRTPKVPNPAPWAPFSLCFCAQVLEAPEIWAVGRAIVKAQKTAQTPEKTPIFAKSTDPRHPICVFSGLCGVFCAIACAQPTATNLRISNSWARKLWGKVLKGQNFRWRAAASGLEPLRAPDPPLLPPPAFGPAR